MIYYKIPISGGVFAYPAGCILHCAYPVDDYMYCKFERVTETGAGWLTITEAEFNVLCPDFPTPEEPPVQEVIATSVTVSAGSIVLTLPADVSTGTLVKFIAPCASTSFKGGIVIDGTTYSMVDSLGASMASCSGAWYSGSQLAVIIDKDKNKAYIQNAGTSSYLKTQLSNKQATITGAATTITDSDLTKSRALVSDSSGKVAVSAVTAAELGYLGGLESNAQAQLNGKAASEHKHSASDINSGTLGSARLPTVPVTKGGTGATTAAAARSNLGIGCVALQTGLSMDSAEDTTTFNYGDYSAYIIFAKYGTGENPVSTVIPACMITTENVTYQIPCYGNYVTFKIKYSGSTVTLTRGGSGGTITDVYGIT